MTWQIWLSMAVNYIVFGTVYAACIRDYGFAANNSRGAYLFVRGILFPLWWARWLIKFILQLLWHTGVCLKHFSKDCWIEFKNIWGQK